ncbi:MAG: hypothetical protein KA444_06615 [Bacteroidia bacterium]|nr:hypothetical protein [Bacteroidia bacterium]
MRTKQFHFYLRLFFFASPLTILAQNTSPIHGNFQMDAQYYFPDSLIGAPDVPEKLLTNGFANFEYEKGNFSAGLRYESYLNPILGFDSRYQGSGIPFRYLRYNTGDLEVTAGSFYEQFGNGLVLRAYEERGLGYDNAIDGFRVKYVPIRGVTVKGLVGRQRSFFTTGEGLVRGADIEWNINESCDSMADNRTQWILGGSFVSKYQNDQDPVYILPENVASGAGRLNMISGNWNVNAEYAYKINDPSSDNGYIYKDGQAFLLNLGYTKKGFGATLSAKRIDNMSYRSERNATGNSLIINYLPALTKNHTYSLAAFYPYATQPNGEFGFQAEVFFNLKAGSKFGGKYGTDININYSRAQAIGKTPIDTTGNPESADLGYTSGFFDIGSEVYFEDFNIEIHRKLSQKWRMHFMYMYEHYNKSIVEGRASEPTVYAHIVVLELGYKISSKKNFKTEIQHMYTEQDKQSWAFLLAEYSIAPHWFVAAFDQYNYGNNNKDQRIHYFTGSIGYTRKANRITAGYGRQRAGILCVGGICRNVPASNGFIMTITSSF